MIVALVNGKGGSGKTTVSILLAAALAEAGHEAAVLDTDTQQTATRWLKETGEVPLALDGRNYDALFIDTPPRLDSRRLAASIRRADLVVLVTSPSPADLYTSRDTVAVIEREGMKQRARVLFNQVETGTILARELDEMAGRIGLPGLKSTLHRRQGYQHAVLLGWRSLAGVAREEVLKVALEITAFSQRKEVTR